MHHTALAETQRYRAVVIGSGIAGLTAALRLGDYAVVTKTSLGEGSSRWAQGGVAAAMAPDDSPMAHAADTTRVGRGLTDDRAVELATAGAPGLVAWLRELGADFDTDPAGALVLGREAGHSADRIVHANGDATGAEIMRTLRQAVRDRPDITVLERTMAIDLIVDGQAVRGVVARDGDGQLLALLSPAVVLATGGIGRLYAATTNPVESTGDGLAMALRAGAEIRDPEFVQFHPTALATEVDPRPLLTEALRGAGAHLVDVDGRRYMLEVHPDAELAPRDVVARANWRELRDHPVYLDLRPVDDLSARFPTAVASAEHAGLDPALDLLPITPAQHYHMGGVRTDEHGRASLPGLYACGEVACTGLHGANRLASNSLVEGLVFGARTAAAIVDDAARAELAEAPLVTASGGIDAALESDPVGEAELRSIMWDHVGLVRDRVGLAEAIEQLEAMRPTLGRTVVGRNMLDVAALVAAAALARTESRGGHHRSDFPHPEPVFEESTLLRPVASPMTPLALAPAPVS